jgi:hypothetical protein
VFIKRDFKIIDKESYKMKIQPLQRKIITVGLLIVPFLSIGELSALFYGQLITHSENLTGLFKISKDIVFILLLSLGFVSCLSSSSLSKKVLPYLFAVAIAVIPAIIFSSGNNLISIASGLRWLMPIILPIFIFRAVNFEFVQTFILYLSFLFLLHFSVQIFQMFYSSQWFGVSKFGFNLRSPGLFLIPSTGAFFSVVVLYVILFIEKTSSRKKLIFIALGSTSVFLTVSGTGYVVLLIIIFFYFSTKAKLKDIFLFLPLLFIFLYFSISIFNSRGGATYVKISGGSRLEILIDKFFSADFISRSFGFGTNTLVLMGDVNGSILDSTYASLLVNLGYFGFFIFIALLLLAFTYSIFGRSKSFFIFLVVFSLFAFTIIIYEAYPANLIMAVILAYFFKSKFHTQIAPVRKLTLNTMK